MEAPGTFFGGYDPFVKAVMFNEFSTAGLRIGHTLIRESFTLADGVSEVNRLGESMVTFFNPEVLYDLNLGVNPYTGIYLGLALEKAFDFDRYVLVKPCFVRQNQRIENRKAQTSFLDCLSAVLEL